LSLLLTFLSGKEYPVLLLGVQSVHGSHIGGWERDKFLDGLERIVTKRAYKTGKQSALFDGSTK